MARNPTFLLESDAGGAQSKRDHLFLQFCDETDFQSILRIFGDLCEEISIDKDQYEGFYGDFKAAFTSWKAKGLFELYDSRAKHPEYCKQQACAGKRVLVVGAGPVGLRGAIEAAFLGAKVDLVEKRTAFNRNNLLHLWPFLISDLKVLGAKKFYGRFCSSQIDHISIKVLQSILLRTCLILGVKVHPGTTFEKLVEPTNRNEHWMVKTMPTSCPINSYGFDVILGADGKQNSLPGFRTREFRGKLALAITVNFVNSFSEKESSVPEISGVTSVYRQDFFNGLIAEHGIELENIVYYKGETHYFVMTAKKSSLRDKKVLKKDHSDPAALLAKDNIDRKALEKYAREATCYATDGKLKDLPFEKNHRGENDVALFDFTSLFKSDNAGRIIVRKGNSILLCLAGDSLLEPFWPTGTGCARGFLGAFDAAWMMKRFCAGDDPLEILDERESILYLLPQTIPERMQKNFAAYTIDPKTRYTCLSEAIVPEEISHLFDTDNSKDLQLSLNKRMSRSSFRMRPKRSGLSTLEKTQHNGNKCITSAIPSLSTSEKEKQLARSPSEIRASRLISKRSEPIFTQRDSKKASPLNRNVSWSPQVRTPDPSYSEKAKETRKKTSRSQATEKKSSRPNQKENIQRQQSVSDMVKKYNALDESARKSQIFDSESEAKNTKSKTEAAARTGSRTEEAQNNEEPASISFLRRCFFCCWR